MVRNASLYLTYTIDDGSTCTLKTSFQVKFTTEQIVLQVKFLTEQLFKTFMYLTDTVDLASFSVIAFKDADQIMKIVWFTNEVGDLKKFML